MVVHVVCVYHIPTNCLLTFVHFYACENNMDVVHLVEYIIQIAYNKGVK